MSSAKPRLVTPSLVPSIGSARLDMLLISGGDDRLRLDPATGRNRYGTLARPAPREIYFSSSTASTISERGYRSAGAALTNLLDGSGSSHVNPANWFDGLRDKIVAIFGVPGSEAILSASGTEAEIFALAMAKSLLRRPLANIVVARDETGAGVMQAAAGTHFDASAALRTKVAKGVSIEGWEHESTLTREIEIRDDRGALLPPELVDKNTAACVEAMLAAGKDVLLHVLDTSKTGQGGPSRSAAREIAKAAPGRVLVVVDACQLRCAFAELKADLRDGFLVMITGSKFAGGPPFCGALLVPPDLVEQLRDLRVPPGLAAYSAECDWPASLRGALNGKAFAPANLGIGLRWRAALAEIESHALIKEPARRQIATVFAEAVRAAVAERPRLRFLDSTLVGPARRPPTIFPIVVDDGDRARADAIYRALRTPLDQDATAGKPDVAARICHVGQPVTVANRSALRICLGMPNMNSVAERLERGMEFDAAMRPLLDDLRMLFEKLDIVVATSAD